MASHIVRPRFQENEVVCEICQCTLPEKYPDTICPACKERELFSHVKEYIRANDVTEFQVADHFNIPLSRVKGWIKEGRIEYKELQHPVIEALHCKECGKPIQFGNFCSECQRKANISGQANPFAKGSERLRYL